MNKAMVYLLEQQDWKAGDKKIAFQSCDDASAQLAKWDPSKCSANAHAYAADTSLIGVIGTFNSGCAAIEIPVMNQAPDGGLQMISPANTYGCLTEPCAGNEPEKYYPSGKRTYARVAPSDPNQAAVDAKFMQEKGVKSVYILNDKEAYGLGVAKNLQGAAEGARDQGPRVLRLRREGLELPGDLHEDQGDEPRRGLHRRPDRREQRPADQRTRSRSWARTPTTRTTA